MTEKADSETNQASSEGRRTGDGRSRHLILLLGVLVLIVNIVFLYFTRQASMAVTSDQVTRLAALQDDLSSVVQQQQILSETVNAVTADNVADGQLQKSVNRLNKRVDAIEKQVKTGQQTIRNDWQRQIDQLNKNVEHAGSRQNNASYLLSWQLYEVERLLVHAHTHIELLGDHPAALEALTLTVAALAAIHDPRVLSLRRVVGEARGKLEVMPQLDLQEVLLQLSSIDQLIDHIPLSNRVSEKDLDETQIHAEEGENTGSFMKIFRQMSEDIQGLVRVRRIDETRLPLLREESEFVLRQTLRLRLQALEVALTKRDTESHQHHIKMIRRLLQKYFDTTDRGAIAIIEAVDTLAAVDLTVPVINLADIVTMVQRLRETVAVDQ